MGVGVGGTGVKVGVNPAKVGCVGRAIIPAIITTATSMMKMDK
jgi:hypothetical protein